MLAREFLTLFVLSDFYKFSDVRIQKAGFLRVDVGGQFVYNRCREGRFVYNWCGKGASLCIIGAAGTGFVYNWCRRVPVCV
jgi:hypothetical protein